MTPVELYNLALLKIGQSKGITAMDEASRAAWTGALVYDHQLRAALRCFPWPFATKYATLTLTQGPAETDATVQAWSATDTYAIGDVVTNDDVTYYATAASLNQEPPNASYWETTATEQANGDWKYAYRWPSDCLYARRIVPPGGNGRTFNPNPIAFRIGRDANGLLIYTNEPLAVLEYTMIDCDNLWTDDLWLDFFTWRLAAAVAPSISREKDMGPKALMMAERCLQIAAGMSSREGEQFPDGEAPWIRAREGA